VPPSDASFDYPFDTLDAIPDLVIALDRDGRIEYANQAARSHRAVAACDPVGDVLWERLPDLAGTPLEATVREVIANRRASRLTFRSAIDGRAYDLRARPYRDGALLSFRDVDVEDRDAPPEIFRELAEQSLAGISVIQDGRFRYVNPRYAAALGYSVAEMLALGSPLAIVHPDDRELFVEQMRKRVAGEHPQVEYTLRAVTRAGATITVDVYGVASEMDGRPVVLSTVVDVSAREAAEAALRASNQTLRAVIDTAPQAIIGVDLDRRVTRWNPAAERLFGWTAAEVIGHEIPIVPEAHAGELAARLTELTAHGEAMETQRRRRDGSLVDVHISRAPLLDADGRTAGYVAILADISARRALEEQLRQALKMEAIGRLAGGVAHDFNNLLTVILSNAELAVATPGAATEELTEIRRAAERAGALTAQLLTVSRRQVVRTESLELNAVVRDAERMLRRVIPESVVLFTDLAPDAGFVRADRGQLEQVLMNLVVNARDAIPAEGGSVFVRTSRRTGAHGDVVVLSVQDTGMGMDDATRSRVFEPFFTTKAAGAGTGLGLATVYGIVRQSDGDVRIDSAPDAGATVTVSLPAVPPPEGTAPDAGPVTRPPAAAGRTVMLVEDEGAVRTVARRILERAGFRVLEATNGAEGLQLWAQHAAEIEIVVTDVVMPGMGGPALVERLLAERAQLPVVFMSGYTDGALDGVETRGRRVFFLAKPFSPSGLLAQVNEALES